MQPSVKDEGVGQDLQPAMRVNQRGVETAIHVNPLRLLREVAQGGSPDPPLLARGNLFGGPLMGPAALDLDKIIFAAMPGDEVDFPFGDFPAPVDNIEPVAPVGCLDLIFGEKALVEIDLSVAAARCHALSFGQHI